MSSRKLHPIRSRHTPGFRSYAIAQIVVECDAHYLHAPPELMGVQRLSLYIRRSQNLAPIFSSLRHRWRPRGLHKQPTGARNWARSATLPVGEAAHRYNNGDPRFASMLPSVFFAVYDIGSWKAFLYLQYCSSAALLIGLGKLPSRA
ncbi:uncharacterized protein TRAVEDRAFT_53177 [Trametes versicolor FP-101664 SS1]|uniref:uncharacterized protein n=1 Tax=Trametes versicolor (strain FP-101664) TaxID=717944 RepID=UPI0004621401|nr:uncharacterized protein TRAVEDRAFT_53177 [Trametes versicolor FP-101664 SS1]EIW52738.1 hypothetical protein TRAVEDRAFT_53177 [Trametes versicolor FP-101664 SS1]